MHGIVLYFQGAKLSRTYQLISSFFYNFNIAGSILIKVFVVSQNKSKRLENKALYSILKDSQ